MIEFVEKKDEKEKQTAKELLSVEVKTTNKLGRIVIRALPLPAAVVKIIEHSEAVLKAGVALPPESRAIALSGLQADLEEAFSSKVEPDEAAAWKQFPDVVDRIWSFGPRRTGTNVLVNNVPGFHHASIVWGHACGDRADAPGDEEQDPRKDMEGFVVTGFQMASLAGPICEEPMTGVAFIVEDWAIERINKDVIVQPLENGYVPCSQSRMTHTVSCLFVKGNYRR